MSANGLALVREKGLGLRAGQKTVMHLFVAGNRACIGIRLVWMGPRLGAAMFFRRCRVQQLHGA
jgi:hypothetical protein